MTNDLLESQHFLKFGKRQYEKSAAKTKICERNYFSMFQIFFIENNLFSFK